MVKKKAIKGMIIKFDWKINLEKGKKIIEMEK
jgi:hypothetical protein